MNNRSALLREIEASYQAGIQSFKADQFSQALAQFTKAKDLLETIPEKEYEDHEYRELGRNYHNIGICQHKLVSIEPGCSTALETNCIPNYKKAEALYLKIINKTPEDAERVKHNNDGIEMAEATIKSTAAFTKFSELVDELGKLVEEQEAEKEKTEEAAPSSLRRTM